MYVRTHTYNQCNKQQQQQKITINANAYAMCFLVRDNVAQYQTSTSDEIPTLVLKTPGFHFNLFLLKPPDGNTHIKKERFEIAIGHVVAFQDEQRRRGDRGKKKKKKKLKKKIAQAER